MKELTKEKAVELHRKLWDEIYIFLINNKSQVYDETNNLFPKTIDHVKRLVLKSVLYNLGQEAYDYGFIEGSMVHVRSDCFLCEYSVICTFCPLCTINDSSVECLNGLYYKIFDSYICEYLQGSKLADNTIELAKIIRDLPVVN